MSHEHIHVPTREEILAGTSKPLPKSLKTISILLAVVGIAVFAIGAFTGVDRVWQAMLVNWLYFTTISSAGVMFVAVQRITTARWSRSVIRLLEGYVAFLPVAFLLLIVILLGRNHIFPWTHMELAVPEKRVYLNPAFLIPRSLFAYAVILALSVWYIWTTVRLDVGMVPEAGAAWAKGLRERMRRGFKDERREIHSTHSLQGRLAVFLGFAFAFGWIVLAWDLSMSIDPHFQSTMYGWWVFMSGWVAALASFTVLTMAWRRYLGAYDLITEKHFHDLGKLCFAFTAFWGYITFGQYLVIWYGNMGEETHWARLRLIQPWLPVTLTAVTLMFGPFFGLMSRAAKVYLPTMALFAMFTVVGLWFHRYLEIYPSIYHASTDVPLGFWEFGITLGFLGIWGFCYTSFMDAFPRMRVVFMTSPFRDEVQVPVNAKTMEPLPAHE
ncbi:MAG TPA: hypothetical protein VM099_09125 [Gemmatimonadaceae bacterium]|nr:hypothetical protein [Gemmatimonadaceae bacterium]